MERDSSGMRARRSTVVTDKRFKGGNVVIGGAILLMMSAAFDVFLGCSSKAGVNSTKQEQPAIPPQQARPFDITAQNLGFHFRGDDIVSVADKLKAAGSKDEFESTAQYQARLAAFRAEALFGATTPVSYMAFVQGDLYDGDIESFEGAALRSNYDADKGTLRLQISLGLEGDNTVIDPLGTGLVLKDKFTEPKPVFLSMTPERARDLKSRLQLLFVCKLDEPWVQLGQVMYNRRSGHPPGSYAKVDMLNVKSVAVWVFDDITGDVLLKQDLPRLNKHRR